MKALPIFGFLILLSVSDGVAQSKKQVKANRIKSTTEFTTETINGKEVNYKSTYTVFDKDGNTTEKTEFSVDGNVIHKTSSKFDGKGNKIEENEMVVKEVKKSDEPKPDVKTTKTVTKYNSSNDKTEEIVYDGSGKQIKKIQTSYNSSGDKTLEVKFDGNNTLIKKEIYNYDKKGLKIEHKTYDGNNILIEGKKFSFQF